MHGHDPLGPPIGLRLGLEDLTSGPVVGRSLHAAPHLHGPRGYLQGGLCAGALLGVARRLDGVAAPATAVDVQLHAPTPLGERLGVVDHRIGAGEHELELLHGDTTTVTGRVQLLGNEVASRAFDLASLATVPLPDPEPQDAFRLCWACGADNPDGLQLYPGWHTADQVVSGWIPDTGFDDGTGAIDPVVVCAALDCPTLWANRAHLAALGRPAALLAGFHVRFFAPAPVHEPVRVVARADEPDGRKLRARSALVDEDQRVFATASALWIAVDVLPERDAG